MTDRISEINAQLASLEAERKSLLVSKKKEVISNINNLMATYEISIEELTAVATKSTVKKTVEAKYQLNDKSWSGRGRLPVFIKEYLKSGKLEDLLIKK